MLRARKSRKKPLRLRPRMKKKLKLSD